MADWRWDDAAGRYRDLVTGRFISHDYVLSLIGQSMAATANVTDALGSFVSTGAINTADWQSAFFQEIKAEYIRQYLAGIGGRNMMTPADWGSIGGMLKEQLNYLKGFANEIAAGNLTEGHIRSRMAMYINSAREAYERARGRVVGKLGTMDEVHWNLDGPIEHCDDCVSRENMGWQPIGPTGGFPTIDGESFPGMGDTQCLTNCACSLSYQNSATGEEWEG